MSARPTFAEACARFVHRYTMEHVPEWARGACINGEFYAPQYRSDREWYENTKFHGESELAGRDYCHSTGQTWPLGEWLTKPFRRP